MYVIFDSASGQWVGLVDAKFQLVPTQALAHQFLLETMAGAVRGEFFADPPYKCQIKKV
jgi:hypothetical protein